MLCSNFPDADLVITGETGDFVDGVIRVAP